MRIALRRELLLCVAEAMFVLRYAPSARAQEFEQYLNPVVPGFGEQPGSHCGVETSAGIRLPRLAPGGSPFTQSCRSRRVTTAM